MTLEEAKKYIGKIIFSVDEKGIKKNYIGGIRLFYNCVDFDVEEFVVYEDKNFTKYDGGIKVEELITSFDEKQTYYVYTMSEVLANQYKTFLRMTNKQRDRVKAINNAKETLERAGVEAEIILKET